ncbi:MAG TPA: MBL fold metallo-hydrolase [Aestuariivirgaceae bacterium]|nr:MBL fold metallo-hydrolase [Aestuariivirgaceae bacterium]
MSEQALTVRFWGTRGSVSAPGPAARQFGGDTACVEVSNGPHAIIFDAGSGLRRLGLTFRERGLETADIFFSHCHYDHIIGLPFFSPLFDSTIQVTLWSGHLHGHMTTRQMVEEFMRAPFFPVRPAVFSPNTRYRDFVPGDTLRPPGAAMIHTGALNHADGAVGYRLESDGRVVAYITDHEHGNATADATVERLIHGADLLVIDATYTDAEYPSHRGWGHSTWQHATALCRQQQVKRLVLFHHRPRRTDSELVAIEQEARQAFPDTIVACDDLEITL